MIRALLMEGDRRAMIAWPKEMPRWKEGTGVLWLNVQAATPEEMNSLAQELGLHPTIVAACLHPEHRSRLVDLRSHVLIVLNAVGRSGTDANTAADLGRWRTLELNLIIGERLFITVHPSPVPAVAMAFQRYARQGEGKPQVEHLLYTIADTITQGYYTLLDRVDKQIDQAEMLIFKGTAGQSLVDRLFTLKRHILYLRRVLGPQRDVMSSLLRRDFLVISAEARPYFMDVYEHILRLFDLLDTYRDLISSSLDAYLTTVSNRMNEVMKLLTIVSTIMLPLTLISGIFGMNFEWMPWVAKTWGFWAAMGLMGAVGVSMAYYFKRRRWM